MIAELVNAQIRNNIYKQGRQPVILKNFSGGPDFYNPAGGERYTRVYLTPEQAEFLENEKVNVKEYVYVDPNTQEETVQKYIKVLIKLDAQWPPEFFRVEEDGTEYQIFGEEIDELDNLRISSADVLINIAPNKRNPSQSIVYLKRLKVKIDLEGFNSKYVRI